MEKLTFDRKTGRGNEQSVRRENADNEGRDEDFGEHDDGRGGTRPGLGLERASVSCTAAEEKRKRGSKLLSASDLRTEAGFRLSGGGLDT